MQDRAGEHGRERDRVAEQHCEEVERDRAEQHARVQHEPDAGDEVVPAHRLAGEVRTRHPREQQDRDERDEEQRGRGCVDGDRFDGEDHAAERRPCDHADLPGDAAQCDRAGDQLGGHELRRQRPSRRVPDHL